METNDVETTDSSSSEEFETPREDLSHGSAADVHILMPFDVNPEAGLRQKSNPLVRMRTDSFFGQQPFFKVKKDPDQKEMEEVEMKIITPAVEENTTPGEHPLTQETEKPEKPSILVRLHLAGENIYPYFTFIIFIVNTVLMAAEIGVYGGIASLSTNPWLGPDSQTLLDFGAKYTPYIQSGQVYRLLAAIFLHVGIFHLLVNTLGQIMLCWWLERNYGFIKMVSIYVISGISGNLLSAVFLQETISVGASSAIFGLFGVLWVDTIANWSTITYPRIKLVILFISLIFSLALGLLPGIDNFAHISGFIMGILSSMAILPDHKELFRKEGPRKPANLCMYDERLARARTSMTKLEELKQKLAFQGPSPALDKVTSDLEKLYTLLPKLEADVEQMEKRHLRNHKRSKIMFFVSLPIILAWFLAWFLVLYLAPHNFCGFCYTFTCIPITDWCPAFEKSS